MKVFISWSGEESGAVAQVLRSQLPCIIQAVKPFVSSEDIEKGAAWFQQIGTELEKSEFGILCLTNSNQNSKWVQFEAGALAGKFPKGRIAPLLINTTHASIKPPLSQFQLTDINNRDDFYKLISSINACLGNNALSQEVLSEVFNSWWNPFIQKVKAAISKTSKNEVKTTSRSEREILEEILGVVRSLQSPEPPGLLEELIRKGAMPPTTNNYSAALSGAEMAKKQPVEASFAELMAILGAQSNSRPNINDSLLTTELPVKLKI